MLIEIKRTCRVCSRHFWILVLREYMSYTITSRLANTCNECFQMSVEVLESAEQLASLKRSEQSDAYS